MLAANEPVLPAFHPRRDWQKAVGTSALPFAESLRVFGGLRRELLAVLSDLTPEAGNRNGVIGGRVHTVLGEVRRIAQHKQSHCDEREAYLTNGAAG